MVSRCMWVGLAMLIMCGGCSLALNWDQGQLTCGPNSDPNFAYACLQGFTCDPPFCVANGSRSAYEGCSDVRQCQGGDLCPLSYVSHACDPNVDSSCQVCLPTCTTNQAYAANACTSGEVCALTCARPATYDTNGLYIACEPNAWVAGCAKTSTCTPNAQCNVPGGPNQGVCVLIRGDNTSSACLSACAFSVSAGAITGDNCGGTAKNPLSCVPVGETLQQQFVCMPQGASPGALNTPCDPSRPCQSTLACLPNAAGTNVCSQLCQQGGSGACSTVQNSSAQPTNCTAIANLANPLYNGFAGTTNFTNSNVGYCK